jgi:hypothetical protein
MKKLYFFLLILATAFGISSIDNYIVRALFSFIIFGWFIALDELARGNIFEKNWINWPVGLLASMICLLPFFPWKAMIDHPEHRLRIQKKWPAPVNVLAFSLKNFWNIKRLWSLFPEERKKFIVSILAMNVMMMGIIPQVSRFWPKFGPSYFVFLILAEMYVQNLSRRIRLSLNLKPE